MHATCIYILGFPAEFQIRKVRAETIMGHISEAVRNTANSLPSTCHKVSRYLSLRIHHDTQTIACITRKHMAASVDQLKSDPVFCAVINVCASTSNTSLSTRSRLTARCRVRQNLQQGTLSSSFSPQLLHTPTLSMISFQLPCRLPSFGMPWIRGTLV